MLAHFLARKIFISLFKWIWKIFILLWINIDARVYTVKDRPSFLFWSWHSMAPFIVYVSHSTYEKSGENVKLTVDERIACMRIWAYTIQCFCFDSIHTDNAENEQRISTRQKGHTHTHSMFPLYVYMIVRLSWQQRRSPEYRRTATKI